MANDRDSDAKKKISRKTLAIAAKEIMLPKWKRLLVGLILILISRGASLVLPGTAKYLVDNILINKDLSMLTQLLALIVGAVIVQAVTGFYLTRLLSVEAHSLVLQLRLKIAKHALRLPLNYFFQEKTGRLVSRIMSDPVGVRNLIGTGFLQLIGGIFTAGFSLVILLRINATMTLFSGVVLIIFGAIMLKAFAYIRPMFYERQKTEAEVTGRLTEAIGGIKVIKGFHAEEREDEVFRGGADKLYGYVKQTLTATAFVSMLSLLLTGVTTAAVMAFSARAVMDGTMTTGDFVQYAVYLALLVSPVVQMSNIGSQLTDAFAGLDRMNEVLNLTLEGQEPNRIFELESLNGHVEFRDVSFEYQENVHVINNISFTAEAGTVTALVGSSGSGKTTISSLVASFMKPDEGQVLIDGKDLAQVKLGSYRKYLAVVLQDDFLFEGSIRENILFGNPEASEEALREAAATANIDEFVERLPEGMDTIIGERGVRLSGGQKQRVSIARAIIANPRILILDEATSNLDTESEIMIQESLEKLIEGRTTFVIAHRLSTIRRAHQILVIEDGRIAEQGTHEELIAKEGRYFQLYTYQARI